MTVFDKRIIFKPFEYPQVIEFKEAIQHSYWLVSEMNFISDIDDYHVKLNDVERNAIRNTILAISQIEVAVKDFWRRFPDKFPKAEFNQVGVIFAESEVRHSDAYSHLLEVLGLNDDFTHLMAKPAIQKRVEYLQRYLEHQSVATVEDKKAFTNTIALFSLFIENVSLFSQFAIVRAFKRHKNLLKTVDNVIQATQKEEIIHAEFGTWMINQIRKEYPHWFNAEFEKEVRKACRKAYKAEKGVIEWIFEAGELDFITIEMLDEFLKHRFNASLEMIGYEPEFKVDKEILSEMRWFHEETYGESHIDFFDIKSVAYGKGMQSYSADDV